MSQVTTFARPHSSKFKSVQYVLLRLTMKFLHWNLLHVYVFKSTPHENVYVRTWPK